MIKLKHAILFVIAWTIAVYLLATPSDKPVPIGHLSPQQVDLLIGIYCKGWSDGAFRAVSVIRTDGKWTPEAGLSEMEKDSADFARAVTASTPPFTTTMAR